MSVCSLALPCHAKPCQAAPRLAANYTIRAANYTIRDDCKGYQPNEGRTRNGVFVFEMAIRIIRPTPFSLHRSCHVRRNGFENLPQRLRGRDYPNAAFQRRLLSIVRASDST